MALFSRQEEIDIVVFVVSVDDHPTESAHSFLRKESNEQAYLFIVVNKFDQIKQREVPKLWCWTRSGNLVLARTNDAWVTAEVAVNIANDYLLERIIPALTDAKEIPSGVVGQTASPQRWGLAHAVFAEARLVGGNMAKQVSFVGAHSP